MYYFETDFLHINYKRGFIAISNFASTRRIPLLVEALSLLSRQCPAIEQGYPIQSFRATFLDAHRSAQLHPAGWLIRGDAQGLVGTNAREPADILDIPLGVVLIRRCPPRDYRTDGIEPIIMIVCACQQLKGSTPSIRHGFKLTELWVCLQGLQALPLIL